MGTDLNDGGLRALHFVLICKEILKDLRRYLLGTGDVFIVEKNLSLKPVGEIVGEYLFAAVNAEK